MDLQKQDSETSDSIYNKAPVEKIQQDKNAFTYNDFSGMNTQSEKQVGEIRFNDVLDDSFDDNIGSHAPLYKQDTNLSID